MRVLFFGDIVGRPGRTALKSRLPFLREKIAADLVIANGENAAGGIGMTKETLREIFSAGVDLVTGGNHTWRNPEVYETLDTDKRVIRPANVYPGAPGRGYTIHELHTRTKVAVINILGRSFMDVCDCPFRAVDSILALIPEEVPLRFVDFHAEATSEKRAMAFYLDGRVSALVGTHTHVQTADATILPKGTAYITDLGMCGAESSSVLGMESTGVLKRFITGLPTRFRPSTGEATLNGLMATFSRDTGKALSLAILREKAPVLYDPAAATPRPAEEITTTLHTP